MADLLIADLRMGRNGIDSPMSPDFPSNQCVEALNVDFGIGDVGGTRGGSDTVSLSGGTAFASGIRSLIRYVPGGDESVAQQWAVDGTGLVKRRVMGGAWANVTLDDAITGNYHQVRGITFNGKLFLFYQSAVNRLHVYDPVLDVVRRVGINPGTVGPTVANQGSGTLSGARYYRVRFLQMNGVLVVRKSEATPASALFTPSGSGLSARVTRPALPSERETHWEVEIATSSSGPWYVVAGVDNGSTQIAIATTTYDDTTTTGGIGSLPASDPAGMYTLLPAMKFGITDNNRLMGAGSWDTTSEPHESRVWLTPVLGSDDRGDDERWNDQTDLKHRIDTSEKNGGSITSILGPVNGVFWTLKFRQVWRHTPTGDVTVPYLSKQISGVVGAISHDGSVLAEDTDGGSVGFFWSSRGPYRLGIDGLLYMGRDIEDILRGEGSYDRPNLLASIPVHGVYHSDRSEVYWWIATGTADTPNLRLRNEIRQVLKQDRYGLRGGWRVDTGEAASAMCSALFADSDSSAYLSPYIGRSDTAIYQCDTTSLTDAGTPFQSYVLTKSIVPPESMLGQFDIEEAILVCDASAGQALTVTAIGDFGLARASDTRGIDAQRDESLVIRKFTAPVLSEQGAIQLQIGDIGAQASSWRVHGIVLPLDKQADQ